MPVPDPYLHGNFKFADLGLQLRLPVDLVPVAQYSRHNNLANFIEGRFETRAGTILLATVLASNALHSIFRLNQEAPSALGERLVGVGTRLFTAPLPNGNVFTELTGFSYSGNPLSIVSFRFSFDQASWAIIADRNGMRKRRGGVQTGYYQKLGITPPTAQATATAGGPGQLDATGGVDFDWRYTYFNIVTGSESNPSDITQTGASTDVQRPTSQTNPDTHFGGSGFTNPANAYDGNDTTFADGNAASASETRQSCQWQAWSAAGGTETAFNLEVDAEVLATGTSGSVYAAIYYSLDSGVTWKTMVTTGVAAARHVYTAAIPIGTALAGVLVRAVVFGSGNTTSSQAVIGRRIFIVAGDYDPTALTADGVLTGGGGNRTIEMKVYEIRTSAGLVGATDVLLSLINQQGNICCLAPTDTQVTHIRLYRRGGSLSGNWYRVGTFALTELVQGGCGVGSLQIVDDVPDTELGTTLDLDNDVPISSVEVLERPLPYIWGPTDERVLGCGDHDRPECVYFSKRGNADEWPPQNFIEVSAPGTPIQNGCVFNTRTFAFSRERMYELIPNLIQGVTFTPYQTPCARGLISPNGLAVADAIYFVAKDGVYRTVGSREQSLTENDIQPLFPTQDAPGRDTNGYEAVDMTAVEDLRLTYHNREIRFTYKGATSGVRQTLIYDIERNRWRAADYTPDAVTFYSEESTVSSLLIGGTDGGLYQTAAGTDNGSDIAMSMRTGSHDMGVPLNLKEYGNVIFDLDPGGATNGLPITITPYINGEVASDAAITVTGTGRQQVPLTLSDVFAFNMEFEITWTKTGTINPILFQYDILWRPEPASVKHWEIRETSYGLPGYHHVRDAYIAIRSSAPVTLTYTFDGTVQTYTIASTGGLRRKVFLPFDSNKAKVDKWSFDSDTQFRLYIEDCEVRVKPWLTSLGYQITKPFGLDVPQGAAQ